MTPPPTHQANEETTEFRRQELGEMSRQLSQRLQEMIDEQNKRVRDFIEQSHSLSPLPGIQVPGATEPPAVARPHALKPEPSPSPVVPQQPVSSPVVPQQPFPSPVVPQQPVSRQRVSDAPPLPFEIPRTINKKGTAAKEKLEGCGGWLFALGIFLLFVLIRSCN